MILESWVSAQPGGQACSCSSDAVVLTRQAVEVPPPDCAGHRASATPDDNRRRPCGADSRGHCGGSAVTALPHGLRAGASRTVWGPGTRSRSDAFRYVENQIVDCVRRLGPGPDDTSPPHVVDLGCGVGSSLCYLAERLPLRGTGVTLSPDQARRGEQIIRDAGLSDRVRCVEGDYLQLPDAEDTADLAYAIESFVHGLFEIAPVVEG